MQGIDKKSREILTGAAWLGISALILKIIGVIYKVPMSYILGDEGMGYFNSAYTVYVFFYIIGSAGIPKAVSILCAKASQGEAKNIFRVVFKIYILIGLLLSLFLMVFSDFLAKMIGNDKSYFAMIVVAPSIFFVCAAGVIRGYLNGKMKFLPVAISELIGGISKLGLGLLFAYYAVNHGFPVHIVCGFSIFGITVGAFLGLIYLYIYYKKESKGICEIYSSKKKTLTEIFKIALPITLASALGSIVNIIDLGIIMNRLEVLGYPETIRTVIYGNYTTLAVPMFGVITNLINSVAVAALPAISKAYAERKYDDLNCALASSIKINFFIAFPSFIVFLLFPLELLSVMFEAGSAALGAAFLSALAPGAFIYASLIVVNTALEGIGKVKEAMFSLALGAMIKALISFLMIGTNLFGALGAPIGTVLSYLISLIFSLHILKKDKRIKCNIKKESLLPLIIALFSLVPATLLKFFIHNKFQIRVNSFLILAVYGGFYIFFASFFIIIWKNKRKICAKSPKNKSYDY